MDAAPPKTVYNDSYYKHSSHEIDKAMRAELYIFDLDGTLVDSYSEICGAFCAALESVGSPAPAPKTLTQSMGTSMSSTVKRLFPHWSNSQTALFRQAFGHAYSERFLRSKPYIGASEVLGRCSERCVIVTNKDERWARPLIEHLGWGDIALMCPAESTDRKPSPKMISAAKAQLVERHGDKRLVSVGDTPSDQAASLAAGVPFMGVGWTPHDLGAAKLLTHWSTFKAQVEADVHGGV